MKEIRQASVTRIQWGGKKIFKMEKKRDQKYLMLRKIFHKKKSRD